MAESVVKKIFPSQIASDLEKVTPEYGLKVAKAIESEWFDTDYGATRYDSNQNQFHRLRLYARGEQSIQKYKDELSINGDLSYLNLDWKPVPIIPKFVDIVVNGIAERTYDIKAYSQDPYGVSKRTKYMESVIQDMQGKELADFAEQAFGINVRQNKKEDLPDTKEELELHMQLNYKQGVELAEEQALTTLFEGNKYDLTAKRLYYDLCVLGIGAVKNTYNTSEGVKIDYVDPASLVYSYTDSPYFDDVYYVGEVKTLPINEVKKQFPHLTDEDFEKMTGQVYQNKGVFGADLKNDINIDRNQVQILYFNWKTYANEVYKVKELATGADKVIVKDDSFNPIQNAELEARFGKLEKSIEVLYEGALVLGTDQLLKWELAKNMLRPKSNYTRVKMNYAICAPRMYKGKIESLVSRITGFAGSVIGRSMTSDGEMNAGKVPIQEIQSGAGGQKMQSLIGTYNYYLQMIRDVTGLNEARDASTPDKHALVGIQKLAAANSNVATRHILQGGLFLAAETAEGVSLRISDIIEYSSTREAFIQSIGSHNVGTLSEMSNLHLYDFGIFIEIAPDEEEKQMLENNIQAAVAQQGIELEDAIDLRNIKNVKLANQLLKVRRKQKLARDQQIQQENIKAQADANAEAQRVASEAEVEKNNALKQNEMQLEQVKAKIKEAEMQQEMELKKELMNHEFKLNMRLKQMENQTVNDKEKYKEDRKDERTKIQASQQSKLIDQRNNGTPPSDFESSGNDVLGGGFDLGVFDPR